jgi:hypothetical protein
MAVHTVNDDIINSAAAQNYFTHADRRVMIGLRATLEMLGLSVPSYAVRKPPGPTPARAVSNAFQADHGKPTAKPVYSDPLGERRMGAAVAKGLARNAKRQAGSSLFNETFGG